LVDGSDDRRRQTAFHEAGHGVAAAALGIMPAVLSIVPRDADDRVPTPSLGRALVVDDSDASPHRNAVWSYAGHAAVVALLRVGTMSKPSGRLHGAGRDFEEASALLGRDPARIRYAKARAVSLVRHYRSVVERAAQLLLRHETLDGQIVDMMVAAHQENTQSPLLEHILHELEVRSSTKAARVK
jgi:hypothetical protein